MIDRTITRLFALLILLAVTAPVIVRAQPQLTPRHELLPLLPAVYFDSGSAAIPSRYRTFTDPAQTLAFTDTLAGDALDAHYDVLNILGYRLRRHRDLTIRVAGETSEIEYMNETIEPAARRGRTVRDYLVRVWEIEPARIRLQQPRSFPFRGQSAFDPLRVSERNAANMYDTIFTLLRPVVRRIQSAIGAGDSVTIERYSLIQFKFDSPDPGPLNERILKEYVFPAVRPTSRVLVIGYTDVIGLEDRNSRLSSQRAAEIAKRIRSGMNGKVASIESMGVGEEALLFSNALPDGRFLNRTVQILVMTPHSSRH